MAQRVVTVLTCDRCETDSSATHSYKRPSFELDLCDEHDVEFKRDVLTWRDVVPWLQSLTEVEVSTETETVKAAPKGRTRTAATAPPKKAATGRAATKSAATRAAGKAGRGKVAPASEPAAAVTAPAATVPAVTVPAVTATAPTPTEAPAIATSASGPSPTASPSASEGASPKPSAAPTPRQPEPSRREHSAEARYLQEQMTRSRESGGVRVVRRPHDEAPKETPVWTFDPDLVDWSMVDFDLPITRLRDALRDGLPEAIPFQYHPDVLALGGVDLEEFTAAVRAPQRVEIRPETRTKKYPVLAFYRGDVVTIMGFRTPTSPMAIAVYVVAKLDHGSMDYHIPGGGGGGARKANGLPTSVKSMLRAIRNAGAELRAHDPGAKVAEVEYKGQCLGKVSVAEAPKATVQSDYQRVVRKMHAIDARV